MTIFAFQACTCVCVAVVVVVVVFLLSCSAKKIEHFTSKNLSLLAIILLVALPGQFLPDCPVGLAPQSQFVVLHTLAV